MLPARSRLTRVLTSLASVHLKGCESCWRRDAVEFADDVLSGLKLNYHEADRLFRKLECPSCDSRIFPETLVVSTPSEELRRFAGYEQFESRHGRSLRGFRSASADRSRRCFRRRLGSKVAHEIRATKTILLDDSLVWYYAAPAQRGPSSTGGRYEREAGGTWYAAGDRSMAAIEALRGLTSGTVKIFEEKFSPSFCVLDLREKPCWDYPFSNRFLRNLVALGYLSEPAAFGQSGQGEYQVPQLIADWAGQCGIDGILYPSTRPSPYGSPLGGDCLAIFNRRKVKEDPSGHLFRFSEPSVEINFPEEVWRLIPIEDSGAGSEAYKDAC